MADIILQLPDAIANQIAAGEVVQRPASVVKELLENALDAGATTIELIVKDAGKQLIQVIDNGKGMSPTDARMCFERHATSKIKAVSDLYELHTFGFRGEALAAIAAVAHVQLITKRASDQLGVKVTIEGSKCIENQPESAVNGTSIAVKNLFYNIPARKNFLKPNTTELKHIHDEFQRVALVHPEVNMLFIHNQQTVVQLKKGNLRQRIVALFGENINPNLVPVQEQSPIVTLQGFIGKPTTARKYRGEQYFFANGRFIKSPYFEHAVNSAFESLIPAGTHPSFFLFLTVDPQRIDVNIHPTKTEVKFEDEQAIYAIVHSACKKALSMFNVAPSIDFDVDPTIFNQAFQHVDKGSIVNLTHNNPSTPANFHKAPTANYAEKEAWKKLYAETLASTQQPAEAIAASLFSNITHPSTSATNALKHETVPNMFLLHQQIILAQVKSGLMLISLFDALYRIYFERFNNAKKAGGIQIQQLLFPEKISFSPTDNQLLTEMLPEFLTLGFDLKHFGGNDWICSGFPAQLADDDIAANQLIQPILDQLKTETGKPNPLDNHKSIRWLAKITASNKLKSTKSEAINGIIEQLFACENPNLSPEGKPTVTILSLDQLKQLF